MKQDGTLDMMETDYAASLDPRLFGCVVSELGWGAVCLRYVCSDKLDN